ncbi:MAG: dihydropteroate synthase [Myxococcales bacterium]|nr:dihydropteroate synthase [Myxococcales bacterium]MDH3484925.1 dihydropteroate synthase [Myxococcales bacterium]
MPELWGVINVTPDSFSDGGRFLDTQAAIAHGKRLLEEGADVLDVGGESSRPAGNTYGAGFTTVSATEEIARVVPVIEQLAGELRARVSIDTVKPEVAEAALGAGASIVNDVRCAQNPALAEVAAAAGAEYVVMHNRGHGEVRPPHTSYEDVVSEVLEELLEAARRVEAAGVPRASIWLDPGLGFAKTTWQTVALLRSLGRFPKSGYRVLVGPSRKSFISELAPNPSGGAPSADDRLGGTAAAVAHCVAARVDAVRAHDVRVMRQLIDVMNALTKPAEGAP